MPLHPRRSARPIVGLGVAVSAVVMLAGPAAAHIDPDPATVGGGVPVEVSLTVEHGCEGSPTVKVAMQVPEGFTDLAPVELPGWTGTVEGRVVTFEGGPLDPETEQAFTVRFTPPAAGGEFLLPFVQTCEVGETAWVEAEVEGGTEPEHPAPVLSVTAGSVPETTAAPATTAPEPTTVAPETTVPAGTTAPAATTAAPDTTAAAEQPEPTDAVVIAPAPAGDDGSGSDTGVIVAAIVALAVLGGGAALLLRTRSGPA